jgi:hypothetical protein
MLLVAAAAPPLRPGEKVLILMDIREAARYNSGFGTCTRRRDCGWRVRSFPASEQE